MMNNYTIAAAHQPQQGPPSSSESKPPSIWNDDSICPRGDGGRVRLLQKQTKLEANWEKRKQAATEGVGEEVERGIRRSLTDEDLDELRGFIDLGFRFDEEESGREVCSILPALDLLFAVNLQFSDPKFQPSDGVSSNSGAANASKIYNPGDSPEQMKTKLRHWAQAVVCSVRQNF